MTKITDIINELKESEMDENILEKTEMTNKEKSRTATRALSKIQSEMNKEGKMGTKNISVKKAFNRKFVAVAAAMVVVLAFGAVAYAAGWINLGKINDNYGGYTATAIEGSNQYKAMVEHQKFFDDEWARKDAAGDESPVSDKKLNAETKRIMDKYNLISDGKTHDTKTINQAFKKAQMKNYLGNNESLFSANESYSWYSDGGRVGIVSSTDLNNPYYEINCTPENVANFYSRWLDSDEEKTLTDEWDYTTDEGIPVKCQLQRVNQKAVLEDDSEITIDSAQYQFILFTGDYVVHCYVDCPVDSDPYDMSKDKFNEFIDGFDFGELL